jgi:von Willebrand factor type A domain
MELRECQAQLEDLTMKRSQLQTDLKGSSQLLSNCKQECEGLRLKVHALENEIDEMDASYDAEIANRSLMETKLLAENEKSRNTQASLEKSLESLRIAKDKQLTETEQNIESLQIKLKDLQYEQTQSRNAQQFWETDATYRSTQSEERDKQMTQLTERNEELQSLVTTLTDHISEYQAENFKMKTDLQSLKRKNDKRKEDVRSTQEQREQSEKSLNRRISKLERERDSLNRKVFDLEKVRRTIAGVVICVDLSGSLYGDAEHLAKDAFRIIVEGILDQSPQTQIGVVVQSAQIKTEYKMSRISYATLSCLDFATVSGTENYDRALRETEHQVYSFRRNFPGSPCRVILISDGEAVGGYPQNILRNFNRDGIPCHNVVVAKRRNFRNDTNGISLATNGRNFTFSNKSSRHSLQSAELRGLPTWS